jgi:hypothetical protein
MTSRAFQIYGLIIGITCIAAVTRDGSYYVRHFLSDESQLTFYASLNNAVDTNIVVLGTNVRRGDTLTNRLKEILSYKPKAVYIDIFYDSLEETQKFDELILLPVVGVQSDLVPYHYSANNFTTREAYGVAQIEDIYYVPKYFDDRGDRLPSVELAVIKEFDPMLFKTLSIDPNPEIVSYIPASNFMFHCLEDPFNGDYDRMLRDKIVVIGNFCTSDPDPYDTWDIHNTPIGRMHGAFVIANGLHTLISDRVYSLNQAAVILLAVIFLTVAFLVVTKVKTNGPVILVIVANLGCALLILGFELANAYLMDGLRIFISQQTIAAGLIIGAQLGILYNLKGAT